MHGLRFQDQIKPEAKELVIEKYVQILLQGTMLDKVKSGKAQTRFFKLNDSKSEIVGADILKSGNTSTKGNFQSELRIKDFNQVLTGKHLATLKISKKIDPDSAFALVNEKNAQIFSTTTRENFVRWVDSLRFLLDGNVKEPETLKEIEELTTLFNEIDTLKTFNEIPEIPKNLPNPPQSFTRK
ncbi:engulfment and cell motility protein [Anaeramoeba ignava]|uniref:Engulfment and cell motility protein n=1 Tax=Anaeramoeba ignava TaxID=1746090 RepID=A0A9Q0LJ57_ANAIG|nr:engulfment and cell motility protein [Anaeramoeba ignava]|eukprot:Anaeramoba_ignava/c21368_g10_i1.p2 GENE.c21368_g10_i1~~c21368_g10_i1.p2  ORF type:complete len:184 (+),score=53.66 c21368_g10_i1:31-582(+)